MEVKKIYFDMDGVLADFYNGVVEMCGVTPLDQNAKHRDEAKDDEMWGKIREVDHFYDKLEPMPGAIEMFNKVREVYGDRCEILTGVPKPRRGIVTAGEDKKKWVKRLLGEDVVVHIVHRKEKKNYCEGADCILVDDYKDNIDEWEKENGTGILHTDPKDTLAQLGL